MNEEGGNARTAVRRFNEQNDGVLLVRTANLRESRRLQPRNAKPSRVELTVTEGSK